MPKTPSEKDLLDSLDPDEADRKARRDLGIKDKRAWDALAVKVRAYASALGTGDKKGIEDASSKVREALRKYKAFHVKA